AHPRFPEGRHVRGQFVEMLRDHFGDSTLCRGACLQEELKDLVPRHPIDSYASRCGLLASGCYEVLHALAASRAPIRRVLQHYDMGSVVLEEDADLAERAAAVGVADVSGAPVDECCRPFEDSKTEPATRGVD